MCIICASLPVGAAAGAKLNVDQLSQPEQKQKPIGRITGILLGPLAAASVIYHTLRWQNQ
jgi:hypothetical protein